MHQEQTIEILDTTLKDIALENNTEKPIKLTDWQKTLLDVLSGVCLWRIWLLLAWQDIRLRYRRSQLGPLWITISMSVQIYTIGFLYGKLFHIELASYYPYLAGGLLTWTLLSTLINESTDSFITAEGYLRQMKMSYTIFVMRVIARNIIIFFHNVLVIIPIILFFHLYKGMGWNTLLIVPGLFILILNGFGLGLLFSMIGARYRDINQVIQNLIQVAFFLTPIMWQADRLPPQYQFAVNYNPFAQFVAIVREPLIGQTPTLFSYLCTFSIGLTSIVLAIIVFNCVRKRIIYWL